MNALTRTARRHAVAAAVAAAAVAVAAPGWAASKTERGCRQTIAKELQAVIKAGLAAIESCRIAQDKAGASGGPCNVVGSPQSDARGKYARAKAKAQGKVARKCPAGNSVLANFPGGDPTVVAYPEIDATLAGNSVLVLGNASLGRDKKKIKCLKALANGREAVVSQIVARSIGCQLKQDRKAATLGRAASGCINNGAGASGKASRSISKACGSVGDVGTCSPLPSCATESSTHAGQDLAGTVFSVLPAAVCGDGAVETGEQCDDGNTNAGDGCSTACETEGHTCTGVQGTRSVRVSVTTPKPLAGVRVDVDYPQFQTGLPGTGGSSLVKGRLALLQGTAGSYLTSVNDRDGDLSVGVGGGADFISSGDVLELQFDSCVPMGVNFCNRNQNVIQCCNATTDQDGDGDFYECQRCQGGGTKSAALCNSDADCLGTVSASDLTPVQGTCVDGADNPPACPTGQFPTDSVGGGSVEDCCPSDNACVSQTTATTCAVSDPVDSTGAPVDGVSCAVTVSGF